MKYDQANTPLVCMLRQSTCYRATSRMTVKGVLWHSTGANNPWLKRYVQPGDDDPDREDLLKLLGRNPYDNDWNHREVQAGLNAWIGQLADGSVAAIQTMPWDYRPWGCGGGCNSGWIQFEICEDSLLDPGYFAQVYREGVELTAYLCQLYGIDPWGKVGNVPTILCHQDAYRFGMGSNHADVYHWFGRYGKTMDDVRADVEDLLTPRADGPGDPEPEPEPAPAPESILDTCVVRLPVLSEGSRGEAVTALQILLEKRGFKCGSAGTDGKFGPKTKAALVKFQQDRELTVDGVAGPESIQVLYCDKKL